MSRLLVELDAATEARLRQISQSSRSDPAEIAARLLRRAVRAARPRPVYDLDAVRANCKEFAAEDLALAESDVAYRAELLIEEDGA